MIFFYSANIYHLFMLDILLGDIAMNRRKKSLSQESYLLMGETDDSKKNCENTKEQRKYEGVSAPSEWVPKFQRGWTTMNYEIPKNLSTQKVMIFDAIPSVQCKGHLWGYEADWVRGLAVPLIDWASYSPRLDSAHSCRMCTLYHMSSTSLSTLKFCKY